MLFFLLFKCAKFPRNIASILQDVRLSTLWWVYSNYLFIYLFAQRTHDKLNIAVI